VSLNKELNQFNLVTELAVCSLFEVLHDSSSTILNTWDKKWSLVMQIAKGLNCLHSNKILHRDLTSRNILVSQQYCT